MAAESKPRHILNSLCTALAILIMHIHEGWPDFVDHLAGELQEGVEHVTCLLMVLKYMASDCDNDSIVIEESIRGHFFAFLDSISSLVFSQIFNSWAQKVLAGNFGQVPRSLGHSPSEEDRQTLLLQRMRSKLVEAFYHWLKLRLPDQVYEGLVPRNPQLLELVFKELENNSDENMENATNCVIELIHVAGKKSQFAAIKDAVMANVSLLV